LIFIITTISLHDTIPIQLEPCLWLEHCQAQLITQSI